MKNFKKKLIYVGTLSKTPDRDSYWIREFSKLGWNVIQFSSSVKFKGIKILNKIKKRINISKENKQMKSDLINLCLEVKPDWLHFRRPVEFDKHTIKKLKTFIPLVTHYFNDDPFSKKAPFGLNWQFRNAINHYDMHFVYRKKNIEEFRSSGEKNIYHVPPMYDHLTRVKTNNYKIKDFIADAAFIGHWENDNRVKFLSDIMEQGLRLIVRGGMWDRGITNTPLERLAPINGAYDIREYNEIYSNVIAGICFFSKINRDTFTRRALEIIAVGGVLVCERTDEAMSYFEDGKEALFFDTSSELIRNINILKQKPNLRKKIQEAGYKKLIDGKFSINDRAIFIENLVRAFFKKN